MEAPSEKDHTKGHTKAEGVGDVGEERSAGHQMRKAKKLAAAGEVFGFWKKSQAQMRCFRAGCGGTRDRGKWCGPCDSDVQAAKNIAEKQGTTKEEKKAAMEAFKDGISTPEKAALFLVNFKKAAVGHRVKQDLSVKIARAHARVIII